MDERQTFFDKVYAAVMRVPCGRGACRVVCGRKGCGKDARRRPSCAAGPCPAGLGEKAVRDAGTFAGGGACLGGVWDEVTEEVFPVFRT